MSLLKPSPHPWRFCFKLIPISLFVGVKVNDDTFPSQRKAHVRLVRCSADWIKASRESKRTISRRVKLPASTRALFRTKRTHATPSVNVGVPYITLTRDVPSNETVCYRCSKAAPIPPPPSSPPHGVPSTSISWGPANAHQPPSVRTRRDRWLLPGQKPRALPLRFLARFFAPLGRS